MDTKTITIGDAVFNKKKLPTTFPDHPKLCLSMDKCAVLHWCNPLTKFSQNAAVLFFMYVTGGIIDSCAPCCKYCNNKMKFNEDNLNWKCRSQTITKRCNSTQNVLHNSLFFKKIKKSNLNKFLRFLIFYFDNNTNLQTTSDNCNITTKTANIWGKHVRQCIGNIRQEHSFLLGMLCFISHTYVSMYHLCVIYLPCIY